MFALTISLVAFGHEVERFHGVEGVDGAIADIGAVENLIGVNVEDTIERAKQGTHFADGAGSENRARTKRGGAVKWDALNGDVESGPIGLGG